MTLSALTRFYISCFISAWGDRIWYFALSIYFVTINNDSLLVTALNGLCANVATITLGPIIGSMIDKYQRMTVITISLFTQNLTVALNCCLFVAIIIYRSWLVSHGDVHLLYAVQAVMIVLNMISKLASMACKISIERDWIIVIARNAFDERKRNSPVMKEASNNDEETRNLRDGDEKKRKEEEENEFKHELTSVNATVRRIDLFTAIISPLCAGLIMSFLNISPLVRGTVVSALFFAVWNVISFIFEFSLLRSVYSSVPELEKPKPIENDDSSTKKPVKNGIMQAIEKTKNGWSDYFSQGVVLIPSLALSVLYLTVLSFDGITIGYAKSQKLSETSISLFQGVGSIMGVLGTIVFPILHNRAKIYLPYIGFIGSCYQFTFLLVCFVAIWLPGSPFSLANRLFSTHVNKCLVGGDDSVVNMTVPFMQIVSASNSSAIVPTMVNTVVAAPTLVDSKPSEIEKILFESSCYDYTSIVVLLGGMALSRFGLWLTDLVIHQIIQESVPESKRGLIGGVQNSLNTVFDLIKFAVVIFLSDITQYGYLVIVSILAVFTAFALYTSYVVVMCARRDTKREKFAKPTNEDEAIQEMDEFA